jgi:hypothetical protein
MDTAVGIITDWIFVLIPVSLLWVFQCPSIYHTKPLTRTKGVYMNIRTKIAVMFILSLGAL